MEKKVLITGGTGFIGKFLTQLLVEKGYSVFILSRTKYENSRNVTYFQWDVSKKIIDERAVLESDIIINLAGENIAEKRWTESRKQAIIESRVQSILLLHDILKKNKKKIDVFISASGIGIYGAKNSIKICSEETPIGTDFLGTTCRKWEEAADLIASLKIRTVKIRTGLVIGPKEGFLQKLIPIFKLKIGTPLGNGEQYMPWIHIEDLCLMYIHAIENSAVSGAYNAVVRDGTTNYIFSKKLAKIFGYALWLPNIPEFLIKIVMGEMSQIILKGQRVSSEKIEKTGFQFKFTKLGYALRDCIQK